MAKKQATRNQVKCPFCNSSDIEMIALFGMQLMTSQYYCHNCHSAFEAVKWDEDSENEPPTPQTPASESKNRES